LVGWYGVFAIECMALGKPVCVYIKEELESYLDPKPLVNTSPERLKEDLRILIEDIDLRSKLGKDARRFAEQIHDSNKIAKYLQKNIYE
jgi:glycosyltransferase involved in cell wall biosynthesis